MRKYPKAVQCDARGQIVIPKDIRQELEIDEGMAFWMYSVEGEGIILKLIPRDDIGDSAMVKKIKAKADKIGINPKNMDHTVEKYKKRPRGRLEEV